MKGTAPIPSTSSAVAITLASPPSCQSSLIETTATGPDVAMTEMRTGIIRELLELIAALDRRVPQVQRVGEAAIAADAAALKARALNRIEELERAPSSIEAG